MAHSDGSYIPLTIAHKQCCCYCEHLLVKVKKSISTLLHSACCTVDKKKTVPLEMYVPGGDCLQNGCEKFKPSGKPLASKVCPSIMGFNKVFDEQVTIDDHYDKVGIDFLYDPDYPTKFEMI